MNRNIPQINISKVIEFNAVGMPDNEIIEVSAHIDSPDEFTPLGRIRFESPEDLLALSMVLDTYIRMYDLDQPDDDVWEEEGGDE